MPCVKQILNCDFKTGTMIDLLEPPPSPATATPNNPSVILSNSEDGASSREGEIDGLSDGTTSSCESSYGSSSDPAPSAYYGHIPRYSVYRERALDVSPVPVYWTELASRVFLGQDIPRDAMVTEQGQMWDVHDMTGFSGGGVGHDGRLLSDAFLSSGRINHAIQLMSFHPDYLEIFLRTHNFLLRGDGPLPFNFRHYIAIMASARFQCTYLMELQKREFLYQGGDPKWLRSLEAAPLKLTSLYHINKMMAHRPWVLRPEDFLHLTKKAGWSLSEVVHAVVLLAHFHSLSSFIHGCGITPEVDFDKGHTFLDPGNFNVMGSSGTTSPSPMSSPSHGSMGGASGGIGDRVPSPTGSSGSTVSSSAEGLSGQYSLDQQQTKSISKSDKTEIANNAATGLHKSSPGLLKTASHHLNSLSGAGGGTGGSNGLSSPTALSSSPPKMRASEVEILMATMKNLSKTSPIDDPEERKKRFETVASSDDNQEKENRLNTSMGATNSLPPEVSPFLCDPEFTYEDFAKRGQVSELHTFRIQDYSWEEQGFSLVNRLYADVGGFLDEKFKVAQNMTYYTMGGRTHVDTTKFRTAVWNYIHCLFGVRHDDYDYGEVNQLLERPLKTYIKTVCCYPERVTKTDYDNVMREFKHSEKIHVNLMIMEAKIQAELLYALRTIMRFIL